MNISNIYVGSTRSKSDVLIAASFQDAKQPPRELVFVDPVAASVAKQAFSKGRFTGKARDVFSAFGPDYKVSNELVLVGLGKRDAWNAEKCRQSVASILAIGKSRNAKTIRVVAETYAGKSVNINHLAQIFPEILRLAEYRFDKYQTKSKKSSQADVKSVEVLYSKKVRKSVLDQAAKSGEAIAAGVRFTRTLINEPGNAMPPRELAARARQIAREGKMRCQVLGLSEIKRQKMGGILAVSQGSKEQPQLVIVEYGNTYKPRGTICLVGKGVTFDTGGISIKPSLHMEKMKYDMSGAAAVFGTMKAISRLKPKVNVVGIAPCVENMPSGTAQRPGDIIKMMNGKSVEVINTDAEGRLILGDALAYSAKFKPKALIDLATLTGACVVALSDKAIAVMGNDDSLIGKVKRAGENTGERCWQLPLWDEYFNQIKGHHSDILNVGGGGGGTITAAMFLKQFVTAKSWAHLDIAGTAWVDSNRPYKARGATGIGVRLLVNLILNWK